MLIRLVGALIFLWGLAVACFGYKGIDLWAKLNINLPDETATYAPYIAIVVGAIIFSMAGGKKSPQRF